MTLSELVQLAEEFGWKEKICDLSKGKGRFVLRAQNNCIVVMKRVRPGQGCRDIFERSRLRKEKMEHELSFNYLRCGAKPHVIGPFGKEGFNLITSRFQKWQ